MRRWNNNLLSTKRPFLKAEGLCGGCEGVADAAWSGVGVEIQPVDKMSSFLRILSWTHGQLSRYFSKPNNPTLISGFSHVTNGGQIYREQGVPSATRSGLDCL